MKPQPTRDMAAIYAAAASRRRRMLRDAKSEAAHRVVCDKFKPEHSANQNEYAPALRHDPED